MIPKEKRFDRIIPINRDPKNGQDKQDTLIIKKLTE
jgi:hypothetical protein